MSRLHALKDLQLRSWIRAGKPLAQSDGGGLTFTLSKTGHAVFALRYRHAGKQHEITLGTYPDLTLEFARRKASDLRQQVADGAHVARDKQRKIQIDKIRVSTFAELANDFLAKSDLRDSTRRETRRHLDKDILPRLGRIAPADLTSDDVVALVESIGRRSVTVARRVYQLIAVICAHGVAKSTMSIHPCEKIRLASILDSHTPRERLNLTREELAVFLAGLPALGRENELALKIVLATCVRKSELIKAEWSHVDFERAEWRIPAANAKTKKEFVIPLPAIVCDWFAELQALAGRSRWVLPARARGRRANDGPIHVSTFNAAIKRMDGMTREPSPHDLRSTARSHLSKLGVKLIVAERCLNHSLHGLVEKYDKHDYLEERRNALQQWAAFIETAERGEDWNVVPFRPAGNTT